MELTEDAAAELRLLTRSADVSAAVATRARIVLWWSEGRQKKEIAGLAGVSRPTVDHWLARYDTEGVPGLLDRSHAAPREQVPARIRCRILAVSRQSPPKQTGLSHWSTREIVNYIQRTEGVTVSHHYVAKLWRDHKLRPHRQGTFKISKDPQFAAKVGDIVGLYIDPTGGGGGPRRHRKNPNPAPGPAPPTLPGAVGAPGKNTPHHFPPRPP